MGKLSLILLFPRSRTSKLLQLTKEGGNDPSNWLPLSLRVVNRLPFANVWGMLLWKLFILRSKTEILVKVVPYKLLLDKFRYSSELKLQNDEGIAPVNMLCETEKKCKKGGGACGSSPRRMLKPRSRYVIFPNKVVLCLSKSCERDLIKQSAMV